MASQKTTGFIDHQERAQLQGPTPIQKDLEELNALAAEISAAGATRSTVKDVASVAERVQALASRLQCDVNTQLQPTHEHLTTLEHDMQAYAKLMECMRLQQSHEALQAWLTPRPYNRLAYNYRLVGDQGADA